MSCLFLPYNLPAVHGDVPKPCSLPTTTNMNASTSAVTTEVCATYVLTVTIADYLGFVDDGL